MLAAGDEAPDFAVGDTTLHAILKKQKAVVFFFIQAFTPT
jgi:peroxiredoxin